jgi:hypothetical protein
MRCNKKIILQDQLIARRGKRDDELFFFLEFSLAPRSTRKLHASIGKNIDETIRRKLTAILA